MRLAHLHRAVQTTLASKRLGKPVFVRYTLQGQDKAENISARLAQITAVVRQWLGQSVERVYALGSIETGQVSLTLQFKDGATALVSYARGQRDGADVMALGNHGALYHDAGNGNQWDDVAMDLQNRPDAALQAFIERAIGSGKPEPVVAEGQP